MQVVTNYWLHNFTYLDKCAKFSNSVLLNFCRRRETVIGRSTRRAFVLDVKQFWIMDFLDCGIWVVDFCFKSAELKWKTIGYKNCHKNFTIRIEIRIAFGIPMRKSLAFELLELECWPTRFSCFEFRLKENFSIHIWLPILNVPLIHKLKKYITWTENLLYFIQIPNVSF